MQITPGERLETGAFVGGRAAPMVVFRLLLSAHWTAASQCHERAMHFGPACASSTGRAAPADFRDRRSGIIRRTGPNQVVAEWNSSTYSADARRTWLPAAIFCS